MEMFAVPKEIAAEFFEAYKGVVSSGEYASMVDELVAGNFIAVEVRKKETGEGNTVEAFR